MIDPRLKVLADVCFSALSAADHNLANNEHPQTVLEELMQVVTEVRDELLNDVGD